MKVRRDSAVCRRSARGVRSLLREIPGGETLLSTAADWQGNQDPRLQTALRGAAQGIPPPAQWSPALAAGRFAAWTSARWVCVFAPVRGHRIRPRLNDALEKRPSRTELGDYNPLTDVVKD